MHGGRFTHKPTEAFFDHPSPNSLGDIVLAYPLMRQIGARTGAGEDSNDIRHSTVELLGREIGVKPFSDYERPPCVSSVFDQGQPPIILRQVERENMVIPGNMRPLVSQHFTERGSFSTRDMGNINVHVA